MEDMRPKDLLSNNGMGLITFVDTLLHYDVAGVRILYHKGEEGMKQLDTTELRDKFERWAVGKQLEGERDDIVDFDTYVETIVRLRRYYMLKCLKSLVAHCIECKKHGFVLLEEGQSYSPRSSSPRKRKTEKMSY